MHIGIIMDGNRTWARENNKFDFEGHKAGAENIKEIVKIVGEFGVKYLTLWALSIDNLEKRSQFELKKIFELINNLDKFLGEMLENEIQLKVIGDFERLPEKTQNKLNEIIEKTKNNIGLVLTLALAYGGQDEIVRATQKIILDGKNPKNLSREEFRKYLDTGKNNLPNPDLIIRTGGHNRSSGFLLYDSEYSEYFFTEKKWPEFDKEELQKAISSLKDADRKFGK